MNTQPAKATRYTQINCKYVTHTRTIPILHHEWNPYSKCWSLFVEEPPKAEPHGISLLPTLVEIKYNLEDTVQFMMGKPVMINGIKVTIT